MRSSTAFLIVAACVSSGCSKGAPAAPAQAEPAFDPKLILKWPGTPSENRQAIPGEAGFKGYSAMLTDKRAGGFIIFAANVNEYPEKTLLEEDPKALLETYLLAFKENEISRKEVKHGSKQYPGLEINAWSIAASGPPLISRRLVVMAGPRMYYISVTGSNKELMNAPEVQAFFDSFDVKD